MSSKFDIEDDRRQFELKLAEIQQQLDTIRENQRRIDAARAEARAAGQTIVAQLLTSQSSPPQNTVASDLIARTIVGLLGDLVVAALAERLGVAPPKPLGTR